MDMPKHKVEWINLNPRPSGPAPLHELTNNLLNINRADPSKGEGAATIRAVQKTPERRKSEDCELKTEDKCLLNA